VLPETVTFFEEAAKLGAIDDEKGTYDITIPLPLPNSYVRFSINTSTLTAVVTLVLLGLTISTVTVDLKKGITFRINTPAISGTVSVYLKDKSVCIGWNLRVVFKTITGEKCVKLPFLEGKEVVAQ